MPRKQPLGRKHKAGTGNNKAVPSTRMISKTKVTTVVEVSDKVLTQRIVRALERDELARRAELDELFNPCSCFALQVGTCDRDICEDWGSRFCCMSEHALAHGSGVYEITPKDQGSNVFVRCTRSQRIAFVRSFSSPEAEAASLNMCLRSCWLQHA